MAQFVNKQNVKEKLEFHHVTDYPGLNIHVEWSINPTNEAKTKVKPAPKKEKEQKYAKFTNEEIEIFFRETRMLEDQNERLQKKLQSSVRIIFKHRPATRSF